MSIDVIVPMYNAEKTIKRTLQSLSEQKCENFGVIIVDDGSIDNSRNIVVEFCKKHKNFRLVMKENTGIIDTIRYGMSFSIADYLGFVDSDDIVEIEMFHEMLKKANEYNCDLVVCGYNNISNDEIVVSPIKLQEGLYDNENKDLIVAKFLSTRNIELCRWNKIYKRNLLQTIVDTMAIDYNYGEDAVMVLKYLINCNKIYILNKHYYNYYDNPLSITKTIYDIENKVDRMLVEIYMVIKNQNKYDLIKEYYEFGFTSYFFNMQILLLKKNIKEARKILKNKNFQYLVRQISSKKLTKKLLLFAIKIKSIIMINLFLKLRTFSRSK